MTPRRRDPAGFTKVPNHVLFDRGLTPGEVRLYAVIACFARSTGVAWPSQATLAESMGISDRQVRNLANRLEKKGRISIERGADRRPFPGPRGREIAPASNRYRILEELVTGAETDFQPDEKDPSSTPRNMSSDGERKPTSLEEEQESKKNEEKKKAVKFSAGGADPSSRAPKDRSISSSAENGELVAALGAACSRSEKPIADWNAADLVLLFKELAPDAAEDCGPGLTNRGALGKNIKTWLGEGFTPVQIKLMIEAFFRDDRYMVGSTSPAWQTFLNRRKLIWDQVKRVAYEQARDATHQPGVVQSRLLPEWARL